MNDNDDAFGIRDGEVAIGLPDTFDASLYFIGRIRTPWTRRADYPKIRANRMPSAPSRSTRGGRRRSPTSKVAPIWWCFIG